MSSFSNTPSFICDWWRGQFDIYFLRLRNRPNPKIAFELMFKFYKNEMRKHKDGSVRTRSGVYVTRYCLPKPGNNTQGQETLASFKAALFPFLFLTLSSQTKGTKSRGKIAFLKYSEGLICPLGEIDKDADCIVLSGAWNDVQTALYSQKPE